MHGFDFYAIIMLDSFELKLSYEQSGVFLCIIKSTNPFFQPATELIYTEDAVTAAFTVTAEAVVIR